MRPGVAPTRFVEVGCLALWLLVILLPLLALAVGTVSPQSQSELVKPVFASLLRTVVLAGIIATVSVILGWLPGRLLGTCGVRSGALLLLLLLPLVLPQYVLYYAWSLLLSPTTQLGRMLASSPALARFVGTAVSTGVLIGWYWPLAALILAQGRRSIDRSVWQNALLDASPLQVFRHVAIPLLSRTILLAFGVCFVLSLSEFATFHLAGVKTVGTELAVLYELTGAAAPVARAAWPVAIMALFMSVFLARASNEWTAASPMGGPMRVGSRVLDVTAFVALMLASWASPVLLLVVNVTSMQPLRQFIALHLDDLLWSLLTAGAAAVLACLIGLSGLLWTADRGPSARGAIGRYVVHASIFLAMFLPASLLAVSLLRLSIVAGLPAGLRAELADGLGRPGIPLCRRGSDPAVADPLPGPAATWSAMASLDGASPLADVAACASATHVACAGRDVSAGDDAQHHGTAGDDGPAAGGPAELRPAAAQPDALCPGPAGDRLVPGAGVPVRGSGRCGGRIAAAWADLARTWVSCCLLAVLVLVGLRRRAIRAASRRWWSPSARPAPGRASSCIREPSPSTATARVFVADKTGRIQHFTPGGAMPRHDPDAADRRRQTDGNQPAQGRPALRRRHALPSRGDLLAGRASSSASSADTARTAAASSIPPMSPLRRTGGSSSASTAATTASASSRPTAISSPPSVRPATRDSSRGLPPCASTSTGAVSTWRTRAIIALPCTISMVIDGILRLARVVGRASFAIPYGLSLLPDGTIVVCEYGNNRIQLFNPQGESLAVYGQSGRELGQLACPWSIAVDSHRRAYVVDAGNNRIQVWQL